MVEERDLDLKRIRQNARRSGMWETRTTNNEKLGVGFLLQALFAPNLRHACFKSMKRPPQKRHVRSCVAALVTISYMACFL